MMIAANARSLALKAKLFRGFSDPSRLAILEALRAGALSVNEVVAATGLAQPTASGHLACLYQCGLVSREQQGRHVYYQLADKRVEEILRLGDALLADMAKGVYECTRYDLPEEKV